MRFYSGMRISRYSLRAIKLLLALFVLTTLAAAAGPASQPGKVLFYVGTLTEEGSKSKGIYAYRFDANTAQITPLGLAGETTNPSFVALHPNGRFLYAVNEVGNYRGPNSGGISAFSIDRGTGKLTFLNEVPSRGADPCYITFDKTGKYVLVANYTGGSVAVFPVLEDGKLGEASAFVQHTGQGANLERQGGPHPHSIDLTADSRFAMVADLGLDELLAYRFDSSKGSLTDPKVAKLDPGAGPRHFAQHPNGKFAYVIAEMHSTVTVFSNDRTTGALHPLQTISTLPKSFTGPNDDAEIEVHPSGKFLYASNRGSDTIAVFAIEASRGTLTPVEYTPTQGKTPRSFEIDAKTGHLTPTGLVLDVASPVCVKFLAVD
jgi:6-phosphogluconolactonase